MPRARPEATGPETAPPGEGAVIGHEARLWQAANDLRGAMDAAEYKHVALGILFLKYVSDAFAGARARLERRRDRGADPDDPDEYRAQNLFWIRPEARWAHIAARARQPDIGRVVDDAMNGIERDNPALQDVLPRDYARAGLDPRRLGGLIDLIGNIDVGGPEARARDLFGRVYEYFLSRFASAEGRRGGEFYTPRCVVRLLVEMLRPLKGRVYDPCCGSAGMFVQSMTFIDAHARNGARARDAVRIYGQESNPTTRRLARMNLAIRGIDGGIAHGDTFHNDAWPDLRADFILANPPFNVSRWGGDRLAGDPRWRFGAPPAGNANFAWVQHIAARLAPRGAAGFVLANGSMSSSQSAEARIRKGLVEDRLVECMVALPGQLFYATQIPVCLWFVARGRERPGETLFIDARRFGRMIDRTHREFTGEDIVTIAETFHNWRAGGDYADEPGFCKSAPLDDVRRNEYNLVPGLYVGVEPRETGGEPFPDKMKRLTARLRECRAEGAKLDKAIAANLAALGFPLEAAAPAGTGDAPPASPEAP